MGKFAYLVHDNAVWRRVFARDRHWKRIHLARNSKFPLCLSKWFYSSSLSIVHFFFKWSKYIAWSPKSIRSEITKKLFSFKRILNQKTIDDRWHKSNKWISKTNAFNIRKHTGSSRNSFRFHDIFILFWTHRTFYIHEKLLSLPRDYSLPFIQYLCTTNTEKNLRLDMDVRYRYEELELLWAEIWFLYRMSSLSETCWILGSFSSRFNYYLYAKYRNHKTQDQWVFINHKLVYYSAANECRFRRSES